MQISRALFQTLATAILGAIAYVWFFVEEALRPILMVILISLFVLLSVEYVREGFSQKKSKANHDIKER
ncbi:MAG: hypothetical protein JSV57_03305 [Candidatus Bathyarchaeota archaeon]|nr:MAG: hypothetical protein JSV57_03305 [Candidatus Bathyarchaeota archaeon]